MSTYKFTRCITDPSHFVNRYIEYASERTEAPWDYHEAQALLLLSLATQGILWQLPAMPGGLGTNLYIINHGATSKAKKSTAMKIAKEIQKKALPGINIPDNFTPGALEEIMSEHCDRAAVLWADEFNGHLDRMHNQAYMAGLRSFLLTMYGQGEWEYKRVSKGKNRKEKDSIWIENSHLCVVGNTTPAIADMLRPRDIDDGFLARFAIIWPQEYPPMKGLLDMNCNNSKRDELVSWLKEIRSMVIQISEIAERHPESYSTVVANPAAYKIFDQYQVKLNERATGYDEQTQSMTQRLTVMALKLSVLCCAGRADKFLGDHLDISECDAMWAVEIVKKWETWACEFVASLRRDRLQREIDIALMLLHKNKGEATRRLVARRLRLSKFKLDEVQMTMLDRGLIRVAEKQHDNSHKATLYWMLPEKWDEEIANAE